MKNSVSHIEQSLTEAEVNTYIKSHGKVDPRNVHEDDRINILKTAVLVQDTELVKECLAIGVEITDDKLLEHAAYYGHYDIVKMLLENGADPTANGCWPSKISHIRCHYKTSNLINQYLRRYKINQLLNEK